MVTTLEKKYLCKSSQIPHRTATSPQSSDGHETSMIVFVWASFCSIKCEGEELDREHFLLFRGNTVVAAATSEWKVLWETPQW